MRDIGTRTADMSCSLDKIILATDQLIGDLFIYTSANSFLSLCRKDTSKEEQWTKIRQKWHTGSEIVPVIGLTLGKQKRKTSAVQIYTS